MLIASDVNGVRYLSLDATTLHREKGFYLCQECKQPIFLRLCLDRISHFAHYADDKECAGQWEPDTDIHAIMKHDIYDYFKKFSWVKKIEFEYPISVFKDKQEKIYLPDIYIETYNEHKIAVECQAHRCTRYNLLTRTLAYVNSGIYPLFILESGAFIGEFVVPRDDLYISPRFDEKDGFIKRFYIYNARGEDIQKYGDIISSLDVLYAKIPSWAPIGTFVETYQTKADFSNYKLNMSRVKYHIGDETIESQVSMIVDMMVPKFNIEKINNLKYEQEFRERLKQQLVSEKRKEESAIIMEKELNKKREEELKRKKEEEIKKKQEMFNKLLEDKLRSIDVDEPWGLYKEIPGFSPELLPPLAWKGGSQVSNLKIMLEFFKKFYIPDKTKIMIYKSCPGSGKSATLLHTIRGMGRGIIVTPFKALQRQYNDDYFTGDKFVMKKDGTRLKVAVLLGRNNFDCKWLSEKYAYQQKLIEESKKPENAGIYINIDDNILNMYKYDKSCANKNLPCTRSLKPIRAGVREPRWIAASVCPFWIPTPTSKITIDKWENTDISGAVASGEDIFSDKYPDEGIPYEGIGIPDEGINISEIKKNIPIVEKSRTKLDAVKDRIKCSNIEYYNSVAWGQVGVFVRDEFDKDGNRCNEVCEYYKQFYHYTNSDVIVMNSAKWRLETMIGRKPLTSIEIFDEGDSWLDNLATEIEFPRSLIDKIIPSDNKMKGMKSDTLSMFDMSLKDIKKKVTGEKIGITDVKSYKDLFLAITNLLVELKKHLEDDERLEEKLVDAATVLKYIDKASVSYVQEKRDESKVIKVFIPFPDNILRELFNLSSKNIIITSGTMHTNAVLSNLFGINANNYNVDILLGRKENPGRLKCIKPRDDSEYALVRVNHNVWQSPQFQTYYYRSLNYILDRLKIEIDKITGKPGEAKIMVLTPAKKYTAGILNRSDVHIDFAKSKADDISIKIDTSLSDYIDKTLEDIRKVQPSDINIDGNVLRTDKQIIVSTRMVRGADLRDDKCRGVVMTKWPYPDISSGYNQALEKRYGSDMFKKIMNDKAERECIQMVSRGIRHDKDWSFFSTPDEYAFNQVFRLFSYDE